MKRNMFLIFLITFYLLFLTSFSTLAVGSWEIKRISLASDGSEANEFSSDPSISSDGRYIAFASYATNFVDDDNNRNADVFLHDQLTGETTLVSKDFNGVAGGGWDPSISADGRYISFTAGLSLVPDDTNDERDVYVYDIDKDEISRVSLASDGSQSDHDSEMSAISSNGRFVAFISKNAFVPEDSLMGDVYVHDRVTSTTSLVSVVSGEPPNPNSGCYGPLSISADGRFIAFGSGHAFVPEDDNDNRYEDVYVADLETGEIILVSDGETGYSPSISANGRFIAYGSYGEIIPDDSNGYGDVYVFDRETGENILVSVSSDGFQGNANSWGPNISADGTYITFWSSANNLVPIDTNEIIDIFIHNINTGETSLISLAFDGSQATSSSYGSVNPVISSDGCYVAYESNANNLVLKDTFRYDGDERDIFLQHNTSCDSIPQPSWLLMYYQAGDNDIHDVMFEEMQDIASVENSDIDIAIFHDGSASSGMPTSYQFISSSGENDYVNKGELNSGDGTTLEDFVSWARTKSNAKNDALIISDHGHALNGVAWDETSSFDKIDVGGEITHALVQIGHLDVLYMHDCLMGNLEFAYLIRGLVDYYVASESQSWAAIDHSDYLSSITPNTTPEQLAKSMADANYEKWHQYDETPSTISVLDMSQVENVASRANDLALAINTASDPIKENIWILLASPYSNLQRYDDAQDDNIINDPGDILADLYHSADLIQHLQDVQPEADLLLDTKDDFILYEKNWSSSTVNYSNSNGVTIAFPTKPSSFYDGEWIEFAQGADWSFVSNSSTDKLSRDSGFYWGPMVSDLVMTYNPDGPDQSEPPDLVPPGNPDSDSDYKIYLPILLK